MKVKFKKLFLIFFDKIWVYISIVQKGSAISNISYKIHINLLILCMYTLTDLSISSPSQFISDEDMESLGKDAKF